MNLQRVLYKKGEDKNEPIIFALSFFLPEKKSILMAIWDNKERESGRVFS